MERTRIHRELLVMVVCLGSLAYAPPASAAGVPSKCEIIKMGSICNSKKGREAQSCREDTDKKFVTCVKCYQKSSAWKQCIGSNAKAACQALKVAAAECRKEKRAKERVSPESVHAAALAEMHDPASPCSDRDNIKMSKACSGIAEMKRNQAVNALKEPYPPPKPDAPADFVYYQKVQSQGYRICFVGDTGNGEEAQKNVAKLLLDNDEDGKPRCNEIRHLGDIIYYVGIEDAQDGGLLQSRVLEHYGAFKGEMSFVLGNHDYYLNPDIWQTVPETAKKQNYQTQFRFPYFYYLDVLADKDATGPDGKPQKGLCLLSLDTTPFATPNQENLEKCTKNKDRKKKDKDDIEEDAYKSAIKALELSPDKSPRALAQLEWLKKIAGTVDKRCSQVISLSHHPYNNISVDRDETLSYQLVEQLYRDQLFKNLQVNLVVAGHDHFLGDVPKVDGCHAVMASKKPEAEKGYECTFTSEPGPMEIVSGSGGMLNKDAAIDQCLPRDANVARTNGFVQMQFLTDSNAEKFTANFKYVFAGSPPKKDPAPKRKEFVWSPPARKSN